MPDLLIAYWLGANWYCIEHGKNIRGADPVSIGSTLPGYTYTCETCRKIIRTHRKQCWNLPAHGAHFWDWSTGRTVLHLGLNWVRKSDLQYCSGFTEDRQPKPVIDRRPDMKGEICTLCATWVCEGCWNYRTSKAIRHPDADPPLCPKCGENKGRFFALRHRLPNHHHSARYTRIGGL